MLLGKQNQSTWCYREGTGNSMTSSCSRRSGDYSDVVVFLIRPELARIGWSEDTIFAMKGRPRYGGPWRAIGGGRKGQNTSVKLRVSDHEVRLHHGCVSSSLKVVISIQEQSVECIGHEVGWCPLGPKNTTISVTKKKHTILRRIFRWFEQNSKNGPLSY